MYNRIIELRTQKNQISNIAVFLFSLQEHYYNTFCLILWYRKGQINYPVDWIFYKSRIRIQTYSSAMSYQCICNIISLMQCYCVSLPQRCSISKFKSCCLILMSKVVAQTNFQSLNPSLSLFSEPKSNFPRLLPETLSTYINVFNLDGGHLWQMLSHFQVLDLSSWVMELSSHSPGIRRH